MKIHQTKTKFKTEWEGSYHAKRIQAIHLHFYVFPTPGLGLFDAIDKPPNCQGRVVQSWVKITQG